jgi:hypothetical protein
MATVFTFMEQLINDSPLKQEIDVITCEQNPIRLSGATAGLRIRCPNEIFPEWLKKISETLH